MRIFPIGNTKNASFTRNSHVCVIGGGYDICIGDKSLSGYSKETYTNVVNFKIQNYGSFFLNGDKSRYFEHQNIEIYQLE